MATQQHAALLTVEEAGVKWCPESTSPKRHPETDKYKFVAGRTTSGNINYSDRCIGDRCAFWRWHDRAERTQSPVARVKAGLKETVTAANEYGEPMRGISEWTGKPEPDSRGEWEIDEEEHEWLLVPPALPPRGYCGKAGHPLQAELIEVQIDLAYAQKWHLGG